MRSSLPRRLRESCAWPLRVAAAAAVAHADVQTPVRAELELPAVVVVVGLADAEDDAGGRRRGPVGIGRRHAIAHHACVTVRVREVDVEQPVARVARMERHREQALLAAARHLAGDVEERLREDGAALEDPDRAGLLDDEEAGGVARRGGHVGRLDVRARDAGEADGRRPDLDGLRSGGRGRPGPAARRGTSVGRRLDAGGRRRRRRRRRRARPLGHEQDARSHEQSDRGYEDDDAAHGVMIPRVRPHVTPGDAGCRPSRR